MIPIGKERNQNLLPASSESNRRYMIFSECIQITPVYDLMRRQIGKIRIIFCKSNCSFIYSVCWVIDEVESFARGLFCLGIFSHRAVKCGVRFAG